MRQLTSVVFAVLCVLCCTAYCLAVTFQDCGSTVGTFSKVLVSGCNSSDAKCILVRGTNASITIEFVPNQNISDITVHVHGELDGISIPFPIKNSDACQDIADGITCPLQKNQKYTYTTSLFVRKIFPRVNVNIKWELVNEKQQNIICVEFPAKLK